MKKLHCLLIAGALLVGSQPVLATNNVVIYQEADSIDVTDGSNEGAAWLKRTRKGVTGRIMTKVETAGDPYTIWWVVINNPGGCTVPFMCNPDIDLGVPASRSSAFYGSGAVSASDGDGGGVLNIDLDLPAGKLPEGMFVLVGDKPGLHYGRGLRAEIWLVVDKHPNPGMASWVPDLTTTNFPGGGPATNHRVAIFPPVD